MNLTTLLEILVLLAVVRAQSSSPAEGGVSAESAEVLTDRDRRGTYYSHRGPPLSPVAPLSIFASPGSPTVLPGELSFHQVLTGNEGYGPAGIISSTNFHQGLTVPGTSHAVQGIRGGRCSRNRPCVPMVYCAPFYEEVVFNSLGCRINFEAYGACCREARRREIAAFGATSGPRTAMFAPLSITVDMPSISFQEVQSATSEGFATFQTLQAINTELQRIGAVLDDPQRPAYGHLQFFRTTPRAEKISDGALIQSFTGEALSRRLSLRPSQASFGLQSIPTEETALVQTCPPDPICGKKETFYRTSDGSCNNLYNPKYGQARTAFERILPPRYNDGISIPRMSVTGQPLPSARLVSVTNVPDVNRPSPQLTLAVMQWGQFIDHDLTHAPIFRFGNDSGIECCDKNGKLIDSSILHPECFPIEIPSNDPFFAQFDRQCMNFVRSRPAPRNNCTIGFREQMNQVTHYLDGSAVYGSSDEDEAELRLGSGGLLKTQRNGLLPPDRFISEEDCFLSGTGLSCFLAGDLRPNEQPHLSIIHTLWVRQHNRIATELSRLNPHWNDETIYQETRRIVSAQIQHIVYNEWLPLVLGTETSESLGLLPRRSGFIDDYDKFLNPNIRNEFATVAFRFGHTLVEGTLNLFDKKHRVTQTINLFENFNRPRLVYQPKKFDQLLRTLIKQPMQSFDNFVIDDLTNRLFQTEERPFGMDLISLNTQRGRDHGVPSYNEIREACGLPRANNFHELGDFVNPQNLAIFKRLYASVDDIDPFVAGISEAPVNGGIVGPLFNCLIRDQFSRLKFGDRFFYENGGMPSSFTSAQLFEIRKTSWAGIVCGNGEHIKKVQPLAFRLPGPNNEKVPCSSDTIPKLDLTPWISAPNSRGHK